MKIFTFTRWAILAVIKVLLLTSLFGFSSSLSAQGIMTRPQTGTIQELWQDDGYVVISGRRVGFDNEIAKIYLNNALKGAEILDQGMVVRYTLDNRGFLLRVEILGPNEKLRTLDQN